MNAIEGTSGPVIAAAARPNAVVPTATRRTSKPASSAPSPTTARLGTTATLSPAASAVPVSTASSAPAPGRSISRTGPPIRRAISAVPSTEPLSTTSTSQRDAVAATALSMQSRTVDLAFRVVITTLTEPNAISRPGSRPSGTRMDGPACPPLCHDRPIGRHS